MDDFFDVLDEIAENGAAFNEGWKIENDTQAEWMLTKLRNAKKECDRLTADIDEQIRFYEEQRQSVVGAYERQYSNLMYFLADYLNRVERRKTKTQESYALPSGTLRLKHSKRTVRDDEQLLAWMQSNAPEYVETVKKPRWGDFKSTLTQMGSEYYTEDGERVCGVHLEDADDTFDIAWRK